MLLEVYRCVQLNMWYVGVFCRGVVGFVDFVYV